MGIFSWLFSKNTEKNSQVRKWIVPEFAQVDKENPDTYAIFVAVIQATTQWGKCSVNEHEEQMLAMSKQYLGDATLFEIACYTYYRLEEWLAKNQPAFTMQITPSVSKLLVEKFYTSLYLDPEHVGKVFKEQVDGYKALAGTEKDLAKVQLALEQRIVMSKGDEFDKKQLPQELSALVSDFQYVKRSLVDYEEIMIATVITLIETYCRKNDKQEWIQKQNQQRSLGQGQGQQDYLFGLALVAQQDWVRAGKVFTKVITENPQHYDALVQRGLAQLELYHAADAMQDFSRAITLEASNSVAYLHRARCYHQSFRQREKALADYFETIRLAPSDAAGYFGRGELYDDIALQDEKAAQQQNDNARASRISEEFLAAIADYTQVIALEPEHDGAYVNRALLYARKARATEKIDFIKNAIADFEKAMSLERTNGYLYKQQDDMQELLDRVQQTGGQA